MTQPHLDEVLIREAAYHLWLNDGQPQGRDEEHWLRAIDALSQQAPKAKPARKAAPKKAAASKKAAAPKKAAAKKAAPKRDVRAKATA